MTSLFMEVIEVGNVYRTKESRKGGKERAK